MKKDKTKKKKREKQGASAPADETPAAAASAEEAAAAEPQQGASEPDAPDAGGDPLERAFRLVGGKWKLRILWTLRSGTGLRYGEVRKQTGAITDMMLSQSLRELTADGLTERRQYQQIPPRVEYRITPAGKELLPAVELLRAWAAKRKPKA